MGSQAIRDILSLDHPCDRHAFSTAKAYLPAKAHSDRGVIGRPDKSSFDKFTRRSAEMLLARILVSAFSFYLVRTLLHFFAVPQNPPFCTLRRLSSLISRKTLARR